MKRRVSQEEDIRRILVSLVRHESALAERTRVEFPRHSWYVSIESVFRLDRLLSYVDEALKDYAKFNYFGKNNCSQKYDGCYPPQNELY